MHETLLYNKHAFVHQACYGKSFLASSYRYWADEGPQASLKERDSHAALRSRLVHMSFPSLATNSSFWHSELKSRVSDENLSIQSSSPLASESELVIIGGGISGVSAAYWLLKMGYKDMLILESRSHTSQGATGRNGGHLWPSSNIVNAKKLGQTVVNQVYQFDLQTMALMEQFIEKHNVRCNYQISGALSLAETTSEVAELEKARKQIETVIGRFDTPTIHTGEQLARETHTVHFKAGLFQARAARFSPMLFTTALAHKAQEMGLKIRTDATVTAVTRRPDGQFDLTVVSPSTSSTRTSIRCKILVHATNAHAAALIPELKPLIKPVRGQVIVTTPTVLRFPTLMCWNSELEYMRQTDDGRIIFGGLRKTVPGGEEGISDDSVVRPEISAALLKRLLEIFPALKDENIRIEYQWTGIMAFTPDQNPLIGPLWSSNNKNANEYIIAGFHGNGMPRCFGAGKALAEMITGKLKPTDWIGPFLPSRFKSLSRKQPSSKL